MIHYPVPESAWPRYTFPEIYRVAVKMPLHELADVYDLHGMYERCEAASIAILQWMTPLDAASRDRIRTGLSRIIYASDQDAAERLLECLHRTGHADSEESLP